MPRWRLEQQLQAAHTQKEVAVDLKQFGQGLRHALSGAFKAAFEQRIQERRKPARRHGAIVRR